MQQTVNVRAAFVGCNIKSGKTVMQFELDPECRHTLPNLAMLTGTRVTLDITSDQTVLFVDRETGEQFDEDELFGTDEFTEPEQSEPLELPEASYEVADDDDDEQAEAA